MEKRIRIVWVLTIITLLLITVSQIYWLYRQSIYEQSKMGKELFDKCQSLIQQEDAIRSTGINKPNEDGEKKIIPTGIDGEIFLAQMKFDIRPSENNQKTKMIISRVRKEGDKIDTIQKFYIDNLNTDAITPLIHRYQISKLKPFKSSALDSLFLSSSLPKGEAYRFIDLKEVFIEPICETHFGMKPYIEITYPINPLLKSGLTFMMPIRMQPIFKSMIWQLSGSVLLIILLVICMIYQIKTILFQKRIDGIRKEFMKNMIYEMKQAEGDDGQKDEVQMLGNTSFSYSMNELRHGEQTVIITSRQAEILQILCDNINDVVSRGEILEKVWGDDSYSNSMALNVQITYIRRAISMDPSLSIEAVMKKGYSLKVNKEY